MKFNKNKVIKIVGIVLIVAGLAVVGTALGMRYYATNKQNNLLDQVEKEINDAQKKPAKVADKPDKSPDEKTQSDTGAIGIIAIPKIDLKVAIGQGVDMDTLKYAVGHYPESALPGNKGNCSIAGHRSYTYSEYFNRLDEVKLNDEIIIRTTRGEFKYKVNDIKVVLPTEVSVLDNTPDATLTLITCTPVRVATHRLIIKAKLET